MDNRGTIKSLQFCPGTRKPMKIVEETEMIANLGLVNDAHARANSKRQILLIEEETLSALGLQPGIVKENITTSGIDLMKLDRGTRVRLGNSVVLELTHACAPCSRMDEIRPGLQNIIDGRRGMLAKVLAGGIVRRGDSITTIEEIL